MEREGLTWALGSTGQELTQPEDDGPLVLQNNLNREQSVQILVSNLSPLAAITLKRQTSQERLGTVLPSAKHREKREM